ncbi:MAG: 50S ribosomal protein L25 [Bacteroidales bacterium]|nr:50S ribosomal protein L25 [Bacteroidales bacterium]MDY6001820.1 50S ribosomal protein L25 [Candidatus Cryptobacteroides sp.]
MKHFELSGTIREVGNKAVIKAFRRQGLVPCNLYGLGLKNVLFTVSDRDLQGLLCTPESFIVDLNLSDGKKYLAIIHELQFHPVKDNCLHVDFLAVNDKKPIAINVPLIFQGHPIGVQKGGKFFKLARELRISALMEDLPDNLVIDINKLDIEKKLTAGDLSYDKVTILASKNTILCQIKSSRQMAADAAKAEAAEEAAEGANAPAAEAAESAAPADGDNADKKE